jgi:hypothetical protein
MPTAEECRKALGGDIVVTKQTTEAELRAKLEVLEANMYKLQDDQQVDYSNEYLGQQSSLIRNKAWKIYRTYHPRDDASTLNGNTESSTSTGGRTHEPDPSSDA